MVNAVWERSKRGTLVFGIISAQSRWRVLAPLFATNDFCKADSMSLHRRIHRAGYWILGLGFVAAVLIYIAAVYASPGSAAPDFTQDRSFNFALERLGGKAAVYLAAFNYWFASLWHGTRLAVTVATLSLVLALMCFWVAELLSYPDPDPIEPDASPK